MILKYFPLTQDRTQVVENDNVEKDVLLRMVIRPEAVSKSTIFDLVVFAG